MTCTRSKRLLLNLVLLCTVLLFIAVVLELFLRITGIQKIVAFNPPIYLKSEDLEIFYTLKPSLDTHAYGAELTTNAMGFRSPEVAKDSRPLVLLGDSVVFGFGVDDKETIGAHLQSFVPTTPILSAALNGYNITQLRATYENTLSVLSPRGLILFFVANDMDEPLRLDDEGYFRSHSDTDTGAYVERMEKKLQGTLPIPFKTTLQMHSALFVFLERTTKSLRSRSEPTDINIDPLTEQQIELYLSELRRLHDIAGDIPKMLVIWPEQNLHLTARPRIKEEATELGFTVLDFYDIYGNSYPSLGWDSHPNAATNRETADIILTTMKQNDAFTTLLD